MPKRSRMSPKEDVNELAFDIVARATDPNAPKEPTAAEQAALSMAAALLGSLGGKKGGPARAAKLSAKRRKEIASRAARTRWKK